MFISLGSRWHWALELLTHFRVQYGLILLGCAVWWGVRQRPWWAAFALSLALANSLLVWPYYVTPTVASADHTPSLTASSTTYRLLSLNVLATNHDSDAVKNLIARENPDIIVLMEMTPRWGYQLRELADSYPYATYEARYGRLETVIYSRYPLANTELWELPLSRPEAFANPHPDRPTVLTQVILEGGQPLALIATHPHSPITAWRSDVRNQQLLEAGQLAAQQTNPTILVGDLNVTPWSPYFQDMVAVSGLREARVGQGLAPSWPTFAPKPLAIPIDHVLASPDIEIIDLYTGADVGSDHLPIIVDFQLR
ncbi:MAG TPA: endonuclease/exonuclease/phosphatase family protein [Anaerolineae bacterium]|nr:endonuclease/exonuclease/phosphatase family protein [Anaerolineae bacterium]